MKRVKAIKDWHLVTQVNFGEAKCLKVCVGGSDRGSNRLHQKLLQILAHKGPGLLQDLQNIINIKHSASST